MHDLPDAASLIRLSRDLALATRALRAESARLREQSTAIGQRCAEIREKLQKRRLPA